MNDIRFVATGWGQGELYINGHRVTGVMSVEPDLFAQDGVAEVTIKLAVKTFTFEPAKPR